MSKKPTDSKPDTGKPKAFSLDQADIEFDDGSRPKPKAQSASASAPASQGKARTVPPTGKSARAKPAEVSKRTPQPERQSKPKGPRPGSFSPEGAIPDEPADWDDLSVMAERDDLDASGTAPALAAQRKRKGFSWGGLFFGAISLLISLAAGLAITSLIEDLFARNPWLGYAAMVLAGTAALALLVFVIREMRGIMRLGHIADIRERAEKVATGQDADKAERVVDQVLRLYASDPGMAKARTAYADFSGDILDGEDRLKLAEKTLLNTKDQAARRAILNASKRVTAVTAISPRALVDVGFVLFESIGIIRSIATIYGGRPTGLGMFRLGRMVIGHLAVTGGIAMTDSVVQQLIGHGLAARLSARLGEGVVNGLLTARIGLSALDVCRPLPHIATKPPRLGDVMGELLRASDKDKT